MDFFPQHRSVYLHLSVSKMFVVCPISQLFFLFLHVILLSHFQVCALAVLVVLCVVTHSHAQGAGRAFPIQAENYVIEQFQNINPRIVSNGRLL